VHSLKGNPFLPDILLSMQAAEELVLEESRGAIRSGPPGEPPEELRSDKEGRTREGQSSPPWWELPPFSPSSDFVSSSFARVLSAVTAPESSETAEPAPAWSDAHVAEEVSDEAASLSYEAALRRGAHFSADWPTAAHRIAQTAADCTSAGDFVQDEGPQPDPFRAPAADQEKRRSSVTIRLTQAECVQLKQRAAEAGLTLSAYIRSCTFEAEALRAQVKQTLAELRATAQEKKPPASEPAPQLILTGEAPRHWWQMRAHAKNLSAQA
jgi:predicted DNA binding CopG/RHH family protein